MSIDSMPNQRCPEKEDEGPSLQTLSKAPSDRKRLLCFLAIFSPFALLWIWLTAMSRVENESGWLEIAEDNLDFGEVWEQEDFVWELPIRNTGSSDLHVSGFRESCSCTKISPSSLVIPAAGTVTVQTHFDLRPKGMADSPRGIEEFGMELAPRIQEARPGAVRWQIRGRVRPYPLVPAVQLVDFGESLIQGSPFSSESVDVRCLQPVETIAASCDSPALSAQIVPSDRPDLFRLTLTPDAALAAGEHDFNVKLKPKLRSPTANDDVPAMTLKVHAPVQRDVYVAPSIVRLGTIAVGRSGEDTVVLGSRRRKPFTLVRVDGATDAGLAIEPAGAPTPLKQVFRVTQRAAKPGESRTTASFVVREDDTRESYSLPLNVTYRGQAN